MQLNPQAFLVRNVFLFDQVFDSINQKDVEAIEKSYQLILRVYSIQHKVYPHFFRTKQLTFCEYLKIVQVNDFKKTI